MNLNMNLKMNILLSGHICNNHSIMTFSRRKTRYLRQYKLIKAFLITHIGAKNILSQLKARDKYP